MFRRFGSRVTIVEAGAQLLAREDADVARRGGRHPGAGRDRASAERESVCASRSVDRGSMLTARSGRPATSCRDGSHLLVATGRTPNSDSTEPPGRGHRDRRARLHPGERPDSRRTQPASSRWATSRAGRRSRTSPTTTFASSARTSSRGARDDRGRLVPYTVYIDPQLGRVGPTEAEARARTERSRRQDAR